MNQLICRSKKMKNRKGFTLVELIVVIVIIGILAAILIPRFTGFTDKAKATQVMVNVKQIATAADALLAEDATKVTNTNIAKLAGGDITASDITSIGTTGNHVAFTYAISVGGISYTATRTSAGAITVTP